MKFDIFFSICQTEVDGHTPNEQQMFANFFEQLLLSDDLGFGCAWLAETHLSCQIQKQNPDAVIPDFQGEIGLNTDIFQLAHLVFERTKQLNVGSAILNIQCNGGPIARAEQVKTCLSLMRMAGHTDRQLELGFASGRFPFSNTPYGVHPRNDVERVAWPVVKGKVFQEATEIFLRLLRGDILAADDIQPKHLQAEDFRTDEHWQKTLAAYGKDVSRIPLEPMWQFDKVGVIPFEPPLEQLRLTIGAHDPDTQDFANQFFPVGVFNLSITPSDKIEATHDRMQTSFHKDGGPWRRWYMPRTVLVFVDNSPGLSDAERDQRARQQANRALENYWKALQGTIDQSRIDQAVDNALVGCPARVIDQVKERFDPDDRLMLWFDFSNHDSAAVMQNMRWFMEDVAPHIGG